jgi:Tfp pilus assembly PilM family ATPase
LLLGGYASTIPQLDQYIANKIGIQVSVANPWQRVATPSKDQQLAAIAAEFAVAVGLAQRENLK